MSNVIIFPGDCMMTYQTGGLIHIRRNGHGWLDVTHESSGGESFATLAHFKPDEKIKAIRFMLDRLELYSPCQVGEVDL